MQYQILASWLPYFYSAAVFAGLWFSDRYIEYIWYIFSGLIILFFFVWVGIVTKKIFSKEQLIIVASPFIFLLGSMAFIILSDSDFLKQIAILMITAGIFFIFRAMYFFHWRSAKYEPGSLKTQIRYLNLVGLFFITTFLYALEVFLNFGFWWNALIIFILILASEMQYIYMRKLQGNEKLYAGIIVFLLTQVFLSLSVLPFLVYVKGIIFLIIYYVVTELYYASTRGLWKKKDIVLLTSTSFVLVVLILITTRWH